ncbi:MAG: hypothetical protein JW838_02295 [Spirochaetes bacterium]|nr:hypothetical protein [Spirochaetota bacterium]
MNINKYPEHKPGKALISRLYVAIMLWIVGRAIQAAAKMDKDVKREFSELPDNFLMSLGILPEEVFPPNYLASIMPSFITERGILPLGLNMIIGKDKKGKVRYMGSNPHGKKITLQMGIKNLQAAMLVFTFRESTTTAFAHDRFIVNGDLVQGLAVVRILNIIEVYLLPKIITKLAVKRYPKWSEMSPLRKHLLRIMIYIRAFTV